MTTLLNKKLVRSLIKKRRKDTHKGDYGHVLIIAGSRGMAGAAVLAAYGALRAGAGLVTAGIVKGQQPLAAGKLRPEAMTLALSETKYGALAYSAAKQALDFAKKKKVTSLVVGPGLSLRPQAPQFVKKIIKSAAVPVVLDADGINAAGAFKKEIKNSKSGIIITPHPGELARFTGIAANKINNDRQNIARKFAKANRLVCVLKGHGTVITDGKKVFVNTTGNPGMAKGGSGDVLSGMIAAFISQVREPKLLNAALVSVYLHGLAGDIAAKKKSQVGMLALDIADYLPLAIKKVMNG